MILRNVIASSMRAKAQLQVNTSIELVFLLPYTG